MTLVTAEWLDEIGEKRDNAWVIPLSFERKLVVKIGHEGYFVEMEQGSQRVMVLVVLRHRKHLLDLVKLIR